MIGPYANQQSTPLHPEDVLLPPALHLCSFPWAAGTLHETQRVKGLLDIPEVRGLICTLGLHIHWSLLILSPDVEP